MEQRERRRAEGRGGGGRKKEEGGGRMKEDGEEGGRREAEWTLNGEIFPPFLHLSLFNEFPHVSVVNWWCQQRSCSAPTRNYLSVKVPRAASEEPLSPSLSFSFSLSSHFSLSVGGALHFRLRSVLEQNTRVCLCRASQLVDDAEKVKM